MIDLRSDAVARPTPQMREAMREAQTGHAAWGEDPTVNALEAHAADLLGKEAALFMPSGTMANQVALRVWTHRKLAPEVICEAACHLRVHEAAGAAVNAGAQLHPIQGERGAMPVEAVAAALGGEYTMKIQGILHPQAALVWQENTHNFAGGAVLPIDNLRAVHELASGRGVPVHMDGARLFNAAVATGRPARELAAHAESVMFCCTKALGAPVGSLLCGPQAFIDEAWRVRAFMGGHMYHAGLLAAAARLALDEAPRLLPRLHAQARALGEVFAKVGLDVRPVETNIVMVDVSALGVSAADLSQRLKARGVLAANVSETLIRAVTHRDLHEADITTAGDTVQEICRELARK